MFKINNSIQMVKQKQSCTRKILLDIYGKEKLQKKVWETHQNKLLDMFNQSSDISFPELKEAFDTVDLNKVLSELGNSSNLDLLNFTNHLLKTSLWPSLKPYSWGNQAGKVLMQPENIVMLILCGFALFTNVLSIIAICHIQHALTMHLKLIINLATSDLLIVFSVLIHIINKMFNSPMPVGLTDPQDRIKNSCIFVMVSSINIMSFLISLLNLLTMAIDHYIAVMNPLRYYHVMSKKRGHVLIATLWVVAAFGGFSNLLFGFSDYESQWKLFNYCEHVMYEKYHAEYLVFSVTIICLIVIMFIYTRIYFEVRKLQLRMHRFPDDSLHNKKAMLTTLLILGTFSLCWLPNCIFQITLIVQIHFNDKVVYELFTTFLLLGKYLYILQLLNCVLDPIIYAVRLSIVKTGYKNFLAKLRKTYRTTKSCAVENDSFISHVPLNRRKTTMPQISSEIIRQAYTINVPQELVELQVESMTCIKYSEGSDINENDIIATVSVHEPDEIQPMLTRTDETSF